MRAKLLRWFEQNQRRLPWRNAEDPYAIWISEVMLQQTQVVTVIPYYLRFMQRFPNAERLAQAPLDEVLSVWSGLGYYRRAQLLHRAAKLMVNDYGGQIPREREARLKLPGFGLYTTGAVGSIAFGYAEPAVDGNVSRVLSRFHAIQHALGTLESNRAISHYALRWVKGREPGKLNQALIELGATICKKHKPLCTACPIHSNCQGRDATHRFPVPRRRTKPKTIKWSALLPTYKRSKKTYIGFYKVEQGLYQGLWSLPIAEGDGQRHVKKLFNNLALDGQLGRKASTALSHRLTHRTIELKLWHATCHQPNQDLHWIAASESGNLAISALTRALLRHAGLVG